MKLQATRQLSLGFFRWDGSLETPQNASRQTGSVRNAGKTNACQSRHRGSLQKESKPTPAPTNECSTRLEQEVDAGWIAESPWHLSPHCAEYLPIIVDHDKWYMELDKKKSKAVVRRAIAFSRSYFIPSIQDLPEDWPEFPTRNDRHRHSLWMLHRTLLDLNEHKMCWCIWREMTPDQRRENSWRKPNPFNTMEELTYKVECAYNRAKEWAK